MRTFDELFNFFTDSKRQERLARRPEPHVAPAMSPHLMLVTGIVIRCLRFAELAERDMAAKYLCKKNEKYFEEIGEMNWQVPILHAILVAYGNEEAAHGERLDILAEAYPVPAWHPMLIFGKLLIWLGLQLVSRFRLAVDSALLALGEIAVMHFYTDVLATHPDGVLVEEGNEIAQDEAHHIVLHSGIYDRWRVTRKHTLTCRYFVPMLWEVILVIVWLSMTWPMSQALNQPLSWSQWRADMLQHATRRLTS